MRTELLLKFVFEASHSLADYEVPHPHIWKLEVAVEGKAIEGRIIDIVVLRTRIQKLVDLLNSTFLNENSRVGAAVREFPTCETLSQFFHREIKDILHEEFLPKNPSILLSSITVAICEMDHTEMGAVRLS